MAGVTRHAEVAWEGGLEQGSGTLNTGSGVITSAPVSWPRRTGEADEGVTSPEELIAAAHAACYAMALSHTLEREGHPPQRLEIAATVAFEPQPGGGFKIARSALRVRGRVPGLDQAQFDQYARQGEQECPVSNALRGNVEISVEAEYASEG